MGNITFKDVLVSLAEEVANIPSEEVNMVIIEKIKEYGLSPEGETQITRALDLIDKTSKTNEDMQEAKKSGKSRGEFVEERIKQIVGSCSEEESETILNAIDAVSKN